MTPNSRMASGFTMPPSTTANAAATFYSYVYLACFPSIGSSTSLPNARVYIEPLCHGVPGDRQRGRRRLVPMAPLEELDGRLPSLDVVLQPQIDTHKENLPFLVSKK